MRKVMSGSGISCSDCGAPMVREVRNLSWTYRGETLNYKQPGLYCTNCDNTSLTDDDVKKTEGIMLDFRAKVDEKLAPSLSPSQIRSLRESLSLSQKAAGEIFGGGPMAFSKYERGEYNVSRPLNILFKLLVAKKVKMSDIERAVGVKPSMGKRMIVRSGVVLRKAGSGHRQGKQLQRRGGKVKQKRAQARAAVRKAASLA